MLATQKGRSNPVRISCKRSEKVKSGSWWFMWRGAPRPRLHAEPRSNDVGRQPGHNNDFVAAGLAGGNGNGRTRHLQKFREKVDASGISLAVHRRRSQRDFQCISNLPSDRVLPGAWMHLHGKTGPSRVVPDQERHHAFFPRENTVSTTSNPATSTSCGLRSVVTCPMLAISATTNTSIITFAAM